MKFKCLLIAATLCSFPFTSAIASEGLNSGDTAWIIVSTALVMMMTPAGLALFYGGLSRYKNLLNTFAMTIVAYCLASVIWMHSACMVCAGFGEHWPPDYLPVRRSTKLDAAYFTAIRNSSGSKSFRLLPQQHSPPSVRLLSPI
jgi:hypothetical protein